MSLKETKIQGETKFKNSFLEVVEDAVTLPNGKESTRVIVKHVGAAAVLPLTEHGDVVLVKQYRYAISDVSLEIPAGKKDFKEEDSLVCARREMREETGYDSDEFFPLTKVHTAIGFSDETIDLFAARGCFLLDEQPSGDEDEFLEVVKMPLSEAVELVLKGKITDAKTVVALLTYQQSLRA